MVLHLLLYEAVFAVITIHLHILYQKLQYIIILLVIITSIIINYYTSNELYACQDYKQT